VHRSGSFIGISFVFITGRLDAKENDFVQIPFHDDEEEEGKEKRERGAKRERFFEPALKI
jgi:hypothetical protein